MSKYYTVIYTDFGDTCDGFARVLGTFKKLENARREMNLDVKQYCKKNNMDRDNDVRVDYPDRIVMGDECRDGCQWQILEIDIKE